jgi:hypothetical protein
MILAANDEISQSKLAVKPEASVNAEKIVSRETVVNAALMR